MVHAVLLTPIIEMEESVFCITKLKHFYLYLNKSNQEIIKFKKNLSSILF